jgi:hypothetical protein
MKARVLWLGPARRCKIKDHSREKPMITGVHAIIYSKQADAVRTFFRDTLGQPSVDAGRGWLIFALPPAELGIHPTDDDEKHELYLMCDDVEATVKELAAKGVTAGEISDQGWGRVTMLTIADGVQIGLYQPRHPTALHLAGR